MSPPFSLTFDSNIGGRSSQEDSVGFSGDAHGGYAVICDGMGGHAGGAEASAAAVEAFANAALVGIPRARSANSALFLSTGKRLPYDAGTTVVGLTWKKEGSAYKLSFFSVGDSYGILLDKNGIQYSTPVEGQGNTIFNYWNGKSKQMLKVSPTLTLRKKGVVLLASDGLEPIMGNLPDVLRGSRNTEPDAAAREFIRTTRAGYPQGIQAEVARAVSLAGLHADNTTALRIEFNPNPG